jgi:LacI family transcriptional regulator
VDGLIIASARDSEFVRGVYAAGIPCVEVGSGYGKRLIHSDNEGAAALAVAHLTALGHRRIAHWRGQSDSYASRHRVEGFVSAARQRGLRPEDTPVLASREAVSAALRRPAAARPTAVFAVNDYQASITLDIARGAGLRVPEDLSVIGFDNNVLAEAARPTLTTIQNPLDEQADAAIALLQALWRGEQNPPLPPAIPTKLIIRESTAIAPTVG